MLLTGGVNSAYVSALPLASADIYSPATETLSPGSITFGGQIVGTHSASHPVTLSNLTSVPLAVTGLTGSAEFSQTNNCIGYIAAQKSCTVNVTFTPLATGARTGSINVTLGDAPFSDTLVLNGTGLSQALAANPGSLALTSVAGTSTTGAVSVSNISASASPVTVAISGAGFGQTNNCPASLAAGASCIVTVKFAPIASTTYAGQLTVTGSGGPIAVPLTGTGGSVALSVTPSALDFGGVQVNDNSDLVVTVQNATAVAFTLSEAISGGPFTILQNSCSSSLAAGTSCSITVEYFPTAYQLDTGALTVTDNTGTVNVINLSGQGVNFN